MRTHVCIFESVQLDGSCAGGLSVAVLVTGVLWKSCSEGCSCGGAHSRAVAAAAAAMLVAQVGVRLSCPSSNLLSSTRLHRKISNAQNLNPPHCTCQQ